MRRVLLNLFFVWLAFVLAFFTPILAGLSWGAVCIDMIVASAATVIVGATLANCWKLSTDGLIESSVAHLLVNPLWLVVAWSSLIFLGLLGGNMLEWASGIELERKTELALELPATFAATALALVSFAVREGQPQPSVPAVQSNV
jgi:hypothetical protein